MSLECPCCGLLVGDLVEEIFSLLPERDGARAEVDDLHSAIRNAWMDVVPDDVDSEEVMSRLIQSIPADVRARWLAEEAE